MNILNIFRGKAYIVAALYFWLAGWLIIPNSQTHNLLTYAVLIIPTLLSIRLCELKYFFSSSLVRWLTIVILTLVLAALFGDGSPLSQLKFGIIIIVFCIAISRLENIPENHLYHAVWVSLFSILVYIFLNMVWMHTNDLWHFGMRIGNLYGKLENAIYVTNTMGALLAIITLIGLKQRKFWAVAAAHILVLTSTLIILQTRSIIPIWILISILSVFNSDFKPLVIRYKILLILILAFIMLSIVYLLVYTSIGESLLSRKFYRVDAWVGFVNETLNCGMWFGCGPNHEFQHIADDGLILVHPHSAYITQFYKAGIVGFLPLIILTLSACVFGIKHRSWAGWYFAVGALGLLVDGNSLIHSPNQRWLVFHLPLAFLIAQQLIHQKNNE